MATSFRAASKSQTPTLSLEQFRTATAPFATGLSKVNMNRKGKSVNKNQACSQLNRYWNTRESPCTSIGTGRGFFADAEDRDLRRQSKTPATDSLFISAAPGSSARVHTLSEHGSGRPLEGRRSDPRLGREARGRNDYRVAADVSSTSRRKVMTCHRSSSGR